MRIFKVKIISYSGEPEEKMQCAIGTLIRFLRLFLSKRASLFYHSMHVEKVELIPLLHILKNASCIMVSKFTSTVFYPPSEAFLELTALDRIFYFLTLIWLVQLETMEGGICHQNPFCHRIMHEDIFLLIPIVMYYLVCGSFLIGLGW